MRKKTVAKRRTVAHGVSQEAVLRMVGSAVDRHKQECHAQFAPEIEALFVPEANWYGRGKLELWRYGHGNDLFFSLRFPPPKGSQAISRYCECNKYPISEDQARRVMAQILAKASPEPVRPAAVPDRPQAPNQAQVWIAELRKENNKLARELERSRMQLAACAMAAVQNTREGMGNRLAPGHEYYSAAYADVCRAVDREMESRERCELADKAQREMAERLSLSIGRFNRLARELPKLAQWVQSLQPGDLAEDRPREGQ